MQPFIWAEKERYGIEIEETPGCVAEHIAIHRGDRIEALGEHEIAKFMGGVDLFFSEAIQERDKISIADRMASLQLTPLQQAAIGGFLEILSMSALKVASCVEMMRCYTLSGWNTCCLQRHRCTLQICPRHRHFGGRHGARWRL